MMLKVLRRTRMNMRWRDGRRPHTLYPNTPIHMNLQYTPVFLLSILANAAQAQPTLEQATMTPVNGYTVSFLYGPFLSPGNGGENQIWDFSSVVNTEQHSILFTSPGSTPNGADFPGATVAQEVDAPSGVFTYSQFNASGVFANGTDAVGFSITHLTDPRQALVFPMGYNNGWSDSFSGEMTGFPSGTISGTITGTADGYGTLMLPWGTFSNVLRVHTYTVTTQVIPSPPPGVTNVVHEDAWVFFKPGVPMQLASIAQADNTSSYLYQAQSNLGVHEGSLQDIGIEVAPNPAADALNVTFGATGHVYLSVSDVLGREVIATDLGTRASGIHRRAMDVSKLPNGRYQLRMMTADGQTGTRPFIVQR